MWEVWAFEPTTREKKRFTIKEGPLDIVEKDVYLNGQCYALALALHEWNEEWIPVCWLNACYLGENPEVWQGRDVNELADFNRSAMVHVMVKSPTSDDFLDIEGYHDMSYSHTNPFNRKLIRMDISIEKIKELMQSHRLPQDMDAARAVARTVVSTYGIK
ncbi:hypothetical protein MK805_11760 [Shimazuella sp. AN120528]|uniref:hypothetical protein n=1 Tax=Shimazuella soli TaxID=1892854 RepID=UPI001F0E7C78|nr:hypothetical protein [Shimazuella soli]MCH5585620.1 hypothetical protein [Shimazuella soli]